MKSFLNQKIGLLTLSLALTGSAVIGQNYTTPQNENKVTTITRITDEKLETFDKQAASESVNKSPIYNSFYTTPSPTIPPKAYLGVSLDAHPEGVVIENVYSNSAAESAGLKAGDIIFAVNEQSISKISTLQDLISKYQVGDAISIKYKRNGSNATASATLKAYQKNKTYYTYSAQPYKTNTYTYSSVDPLKDVGESLGSCEKLEKLAGQAFLGVYLSRSYEEDGSGALISSIINNTGAQKAALQAKDKIIRLNTNSIKNTPEAMDFIKSKKPGDVVQILLLRNGQEVSIDATLGSWLEAPQYSHMIKEWKAFCEVSPAVVEVETPKNEQTPKEEPYSSNSLEIVQNNLSLQVFPNPTSDFININFEGEKAPLQIRIISLDGKEMSYKTIQNFEGNYNEQLDLSSYPAGTYIVHFKQNDKQVSKNIVVN